MARQTAASAALALVATATILFASIKTAPTAPTVPPGIQAILDQPRYRDAAWGLRVIDLDTGEVIHDLRPDRPFLIGSVRKLFSVGLLLDEWGADHRFTTPIYARGEIRDGTLEGDLVLVASGDLTLGGRANADGTLAISSYDHGEANSLGNAELTRPDPLAGYATLADRVAAAGIRRVQGEVIIDDRLFAPFNFRDEFMAKPIFVNDDVVDVAISPASPGQPASVAARPQSQAFRVDSEVTTAAAGEALDIELSPERPRCIGQEGCAGKVNGQIPVDLVPPLTQALPLVRTFRITDPSSYARTVLIESLRKAGVAVAAPAVGRNPVDRLPARGAYSPRDEVASLVSAPFSEYARLILKVSYNLGADVSLLLFGLTQGVETLDASLARERARLESAFGIAGDQFAFLDGSGGGQTRATTGAVSRLLAEMREKPTFPQYSAALPLLGVDGSLGFLKDFSADASLAGARGKVRAKTGTFVEGGNDGPILRAQALAGYIDTRSGRHLAFVLAVNDVGRISELSEVLKVFEDQGRIAAELWRDH